MHSLMCNYIWEKWKLEIEGKERIQSPYSSQHTFILYVSLYICCIFTCIHSWIPHNWLTNRWLTTIIRNLVINMLHLVLQVGSKDESLIVQTETKASAPIEVISKSVIPHTYFSLVLFQRRWQCELCDVTWNSFSSKAREEFYFE